MISGVFIYTLIMLGGIFLGKKGFLKKILKKYMDNLFTVLLILLLFIMGLSFGSNPDIINSITSLGYKAFVIAFCTIISSTAFVHLANKLYDKLIKNDKN